MQTNHRSYTGQSASVSRRTFFHFAAAGCAATLPAVALAEATGEISQLPQLSDEEQLDACVAQLRAILQRMHPAVSIVHDHHIGSGQDGSFQFSLQGDVEFQPYQGDGIYLVSIHGTLCEYLVREAPVVTLDGRHLGWSRYFGRARTEDGGWADSERNIAPNFVSKLGSGAA